MISVIVPVYNVARFLERCVESIINQTYRDLEILLVDDGSTDNSGGICDALAERDTRVRVFHKTNGGLSDARNLGIDMAKGELLAFVDSDDWIDPDMLEILIKTLEKYDADISECGFRHIYSDRTDQGKDDTGNYVVGDNLFALEAEMDWQQKYFKPMVWNKLYKTPLFDDIRFPVGKIHEDEYVTHQLFYRSQKLVYIDLTRYNYDKTRDESITARLHENGLDACDALKERIDFFEKRGLQVLASRARDIFASSLLDRLFEFYEADIKTTRILEAVDLVRREYIHNMETDLSDQYKKDLTMLQISYDWFVQARKKQGGEKECKKWFVHKIGWHDVIGEHDIELNTQLAPADIWGQLKQAESVILYGAGMIGKDLGQKIISNGLGDKLVYFAVTAEIPKINTILDKPVTCIKGLTRYIDNSLVIIAARKRYHVKMVSSLMKLNFKRYILVDEDMINLL